jgi:putative Holliday junction resolvase
MNYLGIDLGEKRIGLATANDEVNLAFPLKNLQGDLPESQILEQLIEVILEEDCRAIVIGLPIRLNGEHGIQALKIQAFCEKLKQALIQAHLKYPLSIPAQLPIHQWDERLSTSSAKKLMQQAGINTKKQKDKIDSAAASLILQAFLDASRNKEIKDE